MGNYDRGGYQACTFLLAKSGDVDITVLCILSTPKLAGDRGIHQSEFTMGQFYRPRKHTVRGPLIQGNTL
jgi:hypothetical protein